MDSMIPIGQKNTLAEYMILSGADNRPHCWTKTCLPSDIYSLVNHHRVSKDLRERIQLLMQGTSLTKQERECKLYDAFDKFAHIKGESLHQYYLRFTQLINDMNIYKIKLEQFKCPKPKREKGNATMFRKLKFFWLKHKEMVLTVLNEEEFDILATLELQNVSYTVHGPLPHNAAYQVDDLDAYDSDCDDFSTAKAVLMDNLSSYGSYVLSKEINYLKQTLFEQSKEKELLTKIFNVFKNESKEKEAKNIDKEIALEKKVKDLDNIVCKMGQSAEISKEMDLVDNVAKRQIATTVCSRETCPDIHKPSEKLVDVTPINKRKTVRITVTNKVPLREPIPLEVTAQESVVTKVYTRRPKVVQIVLWYLDFGCSKHMTEDRSQLTNFVHKFLGTVKFGHNLFSVGQFYDLDLEVAFRKHTCFVHDLKGVDLLSRSWETNLYTLSIGDMMASSPICLLSKASNTKSCKKQSHKPKSKDTNKEKLYLLHMDLCGPMHVASVNGIKYILVIVDDYSRFTWVKFLASKDEASDFIIKFLKMIQVILNATVRNIRTNNGTEFVNQSLRDYYEQVGISHEISIA
ncbi:retrovirus-related pol polyprotein from transposon TNT 1-94 [Tanacetum coccineum]